MKFFNINGYWKDDLETFEDYIVTDSNEIDKDIDEDIFFYGLSESMIIDAINNPDNTDLEFVITEYERLP